MVRHPNLIKTFFKEIETLYDEESPSFVESKAAHTIWASFYSAARECGMSEKQAKQFINSKWFRHNEDEIYERLTITMYHLIYKGNLGMYFEGDET